MASAVLGAGLGRLGWAWALVGVGVVWVGAFVLAVALVRPTVTRWPRRIIWGRLMVELDRWHEGDSEHWSEEPRFGLGWLAPPGRDGFVFRSVRVRRTSLRIGWEVAHPGHWLAAHEAGRRRRGLDRLVPREALELDRDHDPAGILGPDLPAPSNPWVPFMESLRAGLLGIEATAGRIVDAHRQVFGRPSAVDVSVPPSMLSTIDQRRRLENYLRLIERERDCRPAEAMLLDEILRLRAELHRPHRDHLHASLFLVDEVHDPAPLDVDSIRRALDARPGDVR